MAAKREESEVDRYVLQRNYMYMSSARSVETLLAFHLPKLVDLRDSTPSWLGGMDGSFTPRSRITWTTDRTSKLLTSGPVMGKWVGNIEEELQLSDAASELFDLHVGYPEARIRGLDISEEQFPRRIRMNVRRIVLGAGGPV
ncbi:hypothetical protein PV08_01702 [Exophiala spinifera]|uniref:Uncharacterized protein n=1 Tax=Exophiala spinifera TaxID=91928 RepID=A0A0D2A8M3_9EURO|nr:uncharacterized protein PV08_01702 [Exophiala spinifera]KIW21122.1 hypothetical protein PV08_01702 [Exophiala spinifera]